MTGAWFRNPWSLLGAVAIGVLLSASTTSAGTLAQSGGYELQPEVVGTGGTTMHGSTWTLDGTVGQADAIVLDGAGGLHLEGGFWHASPVLPPGDRIFANGFDAALPINGGTQHRH